MKPSIFIDAPDMEYILKAPDMDILPKRGELLRLNESVYSVAAVEWSFEVVHKSVLSPRAVIYLEKEGVLEIIDTTIN